MYNHGLRDYANITQMKFTLQIIAFLKWIVLTVKLNQMKMLKLRLPYLFLIDYAKNLDQRVKKCYEDKIAAIGIDPVLLEGKHFEPDCLPPVEAIDILSYLVLETSY